MRAIPITTGRKILVALDHGDDFFPSLEKVCAEYGVHSGHIPTLIGGFRSARLVGTCEPMTNPDAPLWEEVVVTNLEVIGSGTLAWDPAGDRLAPHIHVSTGLKGSSAEARTSHLLGAQVQFVTEFVIEEITEPTLTRPKQADLYDVPLLTF
jgi:predicted DNA-binding protein with PD1-like motif